MKRCNNILPVNMGGVLTYKIKTKRNTFVFGMLKINTISLHCDCKHRLKIQHTKYTSTIKFKKNNIFWAKLS